MGLFLLVGVIKVNKTDYEKEKEVERVGEINSSIMTSLNRVLVGQENAKKTISSALMCSPNSKILLSGSTGNGKTELANFLASGFNYERITIVNDMIPSEVQQLLIARRDIEFLQLDEFNRANGRLQSAFLEIMAEKRITFEGKKHEFQDFFVVATQNPTDIYGTHAVPHANYDRFDLAIYFELLTEEEKKELLFSSFIPSKRSDISREELKEVQKIVREFELDENSIEILMRSFGLIDEMNIEGENLFSGTNLRAHKFAIELAKVAALAEGRYYILASDIESFVEYLYMHRMDQTISLGKKDDEQITEEFKDVKRKILQLSEQ